MKRESIVSLLLQSALLAVLSTAATSAQVPENNVPENEAAWRLAPINIATQADLIPADVRDARNAYWKSRLTEFRTARRHHLEIATAPPLSSDLIPEIPISPKDIWIIGTFNQFIVVPVNPDGKDSASDVMLYTEITFRVDRIINQPVQSTITNNYSIDEDIPGGVIRLEDGETISQQVHRQRFFVQPGHKYLMRVQPVSDPKGTFVVLKQWEITGGHVQAGSELETRREGKGESTLNGMTVDAAIARIKSVIESSPARKEKE